MRVGGQRGPYSHTHVHVRAQLISACATQTTSASELLAKDVLFRALDRGGGCRKRLVGAAFRELTVISCSNTGVHT